MPVRLGVIADDLTGANDTGVQFARQGARTIVPLDWHDLASLGRHADVLVLCTNSRGLPPGAAAQRAKLAAQALRKARVAAIYKKIDSTFRGNVGAELDAVLDVYPAHLTILAPSFPPAGRAVVNGTLLVNGVPVHRTAIGRDPVAPVRQSHLPTLLRAQSRRSIHHLPLEILRARWPRAARVIRSWQPTHGALAVADAATAADLRRLARLIALEGLLGVAVGSAGLAAALSVALPWGRRPLRRLPSVEHPILLVVGSPNPTSLAQIADFERRRSAAVICGEIREVLAGPERFRKELDRVLGKASAEILAGRDTAITLAQGTDGRRPPVAEDPPLAEESFPRSLPAPAPPSASSWGGPPGSSRVGPVWGLWSFAAGISPSPRAAPCGRTASSWGARCSRGCPGDAWSEANTPTSPWSPRPAASARPTSSAPSSGFCAAPAPPDAKSCLIACPISGSRVRPAPRRVPTLGNAPDHLFLLPLSLSLRARRRQEGIGFRQQGKCLLGRNRWGELGLRAGDHHVPVIQVRLTVHAPQVQGRPLVRGQAVEHRVDSPDILRRYISG